VCVRVCVHLRVCTLGVRVRRCVCQMAMSGRTGRIGQTQLLTLSRSPTRLP